MRKFFERGSGKKMILAENADAESEEDRCGLCNHAKGGVDFVADIGQYSGNDDSDEYTGTCQKNGFVFNAAPT